MYLNSNKLQNEIDFNIYNKNQIKYEKEIIHSKAQNEIQIEVDYNQIEKIINWNYEFFKSTLIPIKTTVSKIKKDENEIKLFETKNNELNIINPQFIQKNIITGARKGTLIHTILQKLDLRQNYTIETLDNFIKKLIFENRLTVEEAECIEKDKILKFLESNLINKIKKSKEIHKEVEFCLKVNAKDYFEASKEDNILIQGIIDLYFIDEDGNIIIVDYKTDFEYNTEKLVQKYKKQLELYQLALEKYFNKKIYKKYLYSLFLNKEIEI